MKVLELGKHVGPDAETVTNEAGGKQSFSPFRFDLIPALANFALSEILHHGAEKYGADNWRDIPDPAEHLNHALAHSYAWLHGDHSEGTPLDQLARAYTRMAFALEMEILRLQGGGAHRQPYQWKGSSIAVEQSPEAENADKPTEELTDLLLRLMKKRSGAALQSLPNADGKSSEKAKDRSVQKIIKSVTRLQTAAKTENRIIDAVRSHPRKKYRLVELREIAEFKGSANAFLPDVLSLISGGFLERAGSNRYKAGPEIRWSLRMEKQSAVKPAVRKSRPRSKKRGISGTR